MPTERDDGSSALDDIKATLNAERAAKPAPRPAAAEPEPEPEDEPEGEGEGEPEGEGEGADETEGETPAGKKAPKAPAAKRDWREIKADKMRSRAQAEASRADRLERESADSKAEVARLTALLEKQAKGEAVDPKDVKRPRTEAEIQTEATAAAKRQIEADTRANEMAKRSDATFDAGVKAYGKQEFTDALENIVGEFNTDTGIFPTVAAKAQFLDRLLDSVDNPERVLFMMGTDPEEAEKIAAMSERRQIAAFVRLSTSRRKTPVSQVAEPIVPVNGSGAPPPIRQSTRERQMTNDEIDKLFAESSTRIGDRRKAG